MQGAGQIGPLLKGMGMQPVQFQSVAEFQKSITTESKMFSIYAVGIKKGYRRETRVKIHTVVDFRNAPSLTQAAGTTTLPGTTPGSTTPATAATTAGSTTSGVGAANQLSTGGQLLYFRVD